MSDDLVNVAAVGLVLFWLGGDDAMKATVTEGLLQLHADGVEFDDEFTDIVVDAIKRLRKLQPDFCPDDEVADTAAALNRLAQELVGIEVARQ